MPKFAALELFQLALFTKLIDPPTFYKESACVFFSSVVLNKRPAYSDNNAPP